MRLFPTEQDLEDILQSLISRCEFGDEYQKEILQVESIVKKKGIELYFNTRDHFSSSSLRREVAEMEFLLKSQKILLH
jgi:glycerol-3-phosphate cytidylyltransferase